MSAGIQCRLVACPVGETGRWDFVLINDGTASLDSAVLKKVAYEWGGYGHSDPTDVRVDNIAPGASQLIWKDNGDGVEGRMDFQLTVRAEHAEVDLLFEFPILYKKRDLPSVDGLGRPGWVQSAAA